MPTFAEHLPGRLPTTLRGRWGAAFGRIFGAACDLVLDGAKDAVKAGFVASAPVDALPLLLRRRARPGSPQVQAKLARASATPRPPPPVRRCHSRS